MLSELSPEQTIQNNVIGTQNVISAATRNNVEKVIFTSSDKAVNPTNVMGTSKLLGERLMSAANSNSASTIFASTRFGNVLGSNGSVVEIFRRQIAEGKKLTITDAEMTRFVMSTSEAVDLVISSAEIAVGGEVFITKMAAIKIVDLATAMLQDSDREKIDFATDIEIIGAKPGEKLYEELMTSEETRRAIELTDYFCVYPAFSRKARSDGEAYIDLVSRQVTKPYVSEDEPKMPIEDIKKLIRSLSG
jgi:FlaA1/EpsC-like NDP-sugar epimerase